MFGKKPKDDDSAILAAVKDLRQQVGFLIDAVNEVEQEVSEIRQELFGADAIAFAFSSNPKGE